jgi:hypothetical protein
MRTVVEDAGEAEVVEAVAAAERRQLVLPGKLNQAPLQNKISPEPSVPHK